jgi:hypothetical protein
MKNKEKRENKGIRRKWREKKKLKGFKKEEKGKKCKKFHLLSHYGMIDCSCNDSCPAHALTDNVSSFLPPIQFPFSQTASDLRTSSGCLISPGFGPNLIETTFR